MSRFHDQWRNHFVPLIFRKAQLANYDGLPAFTFQDEPAASVLSRVAVSAALMLIPAGILSVVGLRRLRRFPVV